MMARKKAVIGQIDKIQHTSNLYYNEPVAKAAKLLCKKSGFDKVLFAIPERRQMSAP